MNATNSPFERDKTPPEHDKPPAQHDKPKKEALCRGKEQFQVIYFQYMPKRDKPHRERDKLPFERDKTPPEHDKPPAQHDKPKNPPQNQQKKAPRHSEKPHPHLKTRSHRPNRHRILIPIIKKTMRQRTIKVNTIPLTKRMTLTL